MGGTRATSGVRGRNETDAAAVEMAMHRNNRWVMSVSVRARQDTTRVGCELGSVVGSRRSCSSLMCVRLAGGEMRDRPTAVTVTITSCDVCC